jgi:anti-sigma factor RsiW
MFCDEALEAIEPIAAGDVTPDGRIAAHVATCPNCGRALERARALERMLGQRSAPQAPAQFTARTLGRVRRARWRSDQLLDLGFNLAITAIVAGVVGAVWALLHRSGLTAVSNGATDVLTSGLLTFAQRIAPSVPIYAGATALVASALGIWWWAERDVSL